MKNVRPEFIINRFCPSSLVLVKTCVTFRLFVLKNPVHCEIRALSSERFGLVDYSTRS